MKRDNETILDIIADFKKHAEIYWGNYLVRDGWHQRIKAKEALEKSTFYSNLHDRLKAAYKREIDAVRPFVRDAEAAYSEAILFTPNEEAEKDVIYRQGAAQEWLNNHPQEEKNDGPR